MVRILTALVTRSPGIALLDGLLDTGVTLGVFAGCLFIRGLSARILQTLIALFSVGAAVGFAMLVATLVMQLAPAPILATNAALAIIGPLYIFNVIVNAHILRAALSSRLAPAFLIAALTAAAIWGVGLLLYGVQAPPARGVGALGGAAK
jgi:hypothetical protein